MERWVPLFDIFLNSPTPETEASLWLQQSFDPSPPTPITSASFLSLLTEPVDVVSGVSNSSSSLPPATTKMYMFIQTLPGTVQSRVLSFLAYEHEKFSKRELSRLAKNVLGRDEGGDFWAEIAARHLLDKISESSCDPLFGFSLGCGEEEVMREFTLVPDWLKDAAIGNELSLPWLPLAPGDLSCPELDVFGVEREGSLSVLVREDGGDKLEEAVEEMEIDHPVHVALGQEIRDKAVSLRAQVVNYVTSSMTIELASEIRQLCLEVGGDPLEVLSLIEPWNADDETVSILISHLSEGGEDNLSWPSQVLCSVILPKMLVLEEAASRVLMTAVVEYCKLHKRAAEYALLLPLVMRRDGINKPICDVVTRIVKDCLHTAHVSAFCQKLLCGGEDKKGRIFLPCHQDLLSDELVWTESSFTLFHDILNLDVQFTQDCVDHIVFQISELAQKFSRSLKFGNFFLCILSKCATLLRSHKLILAEAASQTNTFLTKSIVSKLSTL